MLLIYTSGRECRSRLDPWGSEIDPTRCSKDPQRRRRLVATTSEPSIVELDEAHRLVWSICHYLRWRVGIVTGLGAVVFRALIGLIHNLLQGTAKKRHQNLMWALRSIHISAKVLQDVTRLTLRSPDHLPFAEVS